MVFRSPSRARGARPMSSIRDGRDSPQV
jgi:hypothetical protein